jgi:23S rRNA (adenine1618-N6)-methyltransferase
MSSNKTQQTKSRLHPRNKNRDRYDLDALIVAIPELKKYVLPNKFGVDSVDFSDPKAVKLLNTALLHHYYGIKHWEFSDDNLCPPIPGRADYIHYIADLLAENNSGTIPTGDKIVGLDLGVGASCIYPILGVAEYGWQFIGSDIDSKSIAYAQKIADSNPTLKGKIDCRIQTNPSAMFKGILNKEEKVDFVICNPPFHASVEEAQKGTRRKVKNLSGKTEKVPVQNFAGNSSELVYKGGEYRFISNIIIESTHFSKNCCWFTTLVSKESNLKGIYKLLEQTKATQIKTIPMGTGNKTSRIVAWTFLSKDELTEWKIGKA